MTYLDLEERALAADADRRGAKYAEGLALLGPRLAEFNDRFASQLQASKDAWAAELAQAQAMGFKPSAA